MMMSVLQYSAVNNTTYCYISSRYVPKGKQGSYSTCAALSTNAAWLT